jgi:hypothetical protein
MTVHSTRRAASVLTLALVALGCLGCGGGYEKYIPPEAASRKALETALDAWQSGKSPGVVASGSPSVAAVDTRWSAGQKLTSYQIVSEESVDGQKFYSVKLSLKNPAREEVVRYVVVGRDPLWVYSEDDLKSNKGM